MQKHTMAACTILVLFGCSREPTKVPAAVTQSQVANPAPPLKSHFGRLRAPNANNWYFSVEEGSTLIQLFPTSGEPQQQTIVVPGAHIVGVFTRIVDDERNLLVSTIDQSELASLYRYSDSDGDGAPNESSQQLLFSSTERMFVTDLDWDENSNVYLLDHRCQDVWVARDTNASGWPDSLDAAAFARSDDHPELLSVRAVYTRAPGHVALLRWVLRPGSGVASDHDHWIAIDSDGDGIAEQFFARESASRAPNVYGRPYEGQTEILVLGESGRTVKVTRIGETSETVIGSVALTTEFEFTPITLSSALMESERIRVEFDETNVGSAEFAVRSSDPQALQMLRQTWKVDIGATATLHGLNLTPDMTVTLETATGSTHTLTYTYVDSNSVTVFVPPLPLSETGRGFITAIAAAQPVNTHITHAPCAICEPDVEEE